MANAIVTLMETRAVVTFAGPEGMTALLAQAQAAAAAAEGASADLGEAVDAAQAAQAAAEAATSDKADKDLDNVADAVLIARSARTIPVNNLVAFLGDSIIRDAVANVADNLRNANRGLLHWVPFLTHQRFQSRQDLNFGVSGETSGQIAARVGQVIASGAGTCVIIAGTNDIGTNNFAQTTTNLAAIYQALAAANILIIAMPILPRDLTGGSPQFGFMNRVNRWIEDQAAVYPNFRFINPWRFGDFYSLQAGPRAGWTFDGLHPKAIGYRYIGQAIADYLNTLRPKPIRQINSITDFFVPVHNPNGFLNANPSMNGVAGTRGSGVDGTVADDWNLTADAGGGNLTGLTVAGSSVISDDGLVAQRILVGGSCSGGYQSIIALDDYGLAYQDQLKAGDTIQCISDLSVAGGTVGIAGISAYVGVEQNGVWKYAWDGYPNVGDHDLSVDAFAGVQRSPRLTLTHDVGLGNARCGVWIFLGNSLAAARGLDLTVKNIAVRKV